MPCSSTSMSLALTQCIYQATGCAKQGLGKCSVLLLTCCTWGQCMANAAVSSCLQVPVSVERYFTYCTHDITCNLLLLECEHQTADIMEAAIVLALKTRLKQWQDIRAEVDSDAFSLMEGRFRSMGIHGQGWRTPLELTAHQLEVSCSNM